MKLTPDMNERTGLYLGTEINETWWRRYTKDALAVRGNGSYWNDKEAFYFLRAFIKAPIVIPFNSVEGFKTGSWHSGKWCFGYPILKIIWLKDGLKLSSGFLISKNTGDVMGFIAELEKLSPARNSPPAV